MEIVMTRRSPSSSVFPPKLMSRLTRLFVAPPPPRPPRLRVTPSERVIAAGDHQRPMGHLVTRSRGDAETAGMEIFEATMQSLLERVSSKVDEQAHAFVRGLA